MPLLQMNPAESRAAAIHLYELPVVHGHSGRALGPNPDEILARRARMNEPAPVNRERRAALRLRWKAALVQIDTGLDPRQKRRGVRVEAQARWCTRP